MTNISVIHQYPAVRLQYIAIQLRISSVNVLPNCHRLFLESEWV